MAILLANNARSALVNPIGALDTTITITSGTETLFPSPTGGDYFYATLEDSTKTIREIVKCTSRTANVLTVVRAQDDTSATIFAAGSTVELRINKASLTDSVGAAANSATAAAASATNAANSATNSAASASSAATQVTLAAAQVALATTQANNAASSATAAASSATAANASAVAAAASAASGLYRQVLDKSADYTIVAADQGTLFRMNTGSGTLTVTLPQISTVTDGFKVSVVKWTSDANPVNIVRSGSDTINGAPSAQIGSQYSQIIFVADFESNTWFASQSGLGATNVNIDVKSGDGTTTVFTLSGDPSTKNNTNIYISGVYQAKATYSVSGTTLTFTTAPPAGTNNIEIEYATPLAIGTPSDGTVTTSKIVDANVTAAKLASGAAVANIGTGGITSNELAANSVSYAKLSSDMQGATFGFKNRIINGAMMIDQRNAGALIPASGGGYPVDRFNAFTTGITSSTISTQQVSDAPAGFTNSLKITVTAAGTGYGAGGRSGVYQRIEGYNVADLMFGSSAASTVTLSFWVKASIAGSYSASLSNNAGDRSYPFSYAINSANTWEQKTVTIAGDQSGTWLKDNGRGIVVEWCLGAESAKLGTANTWASAWYTGVTGTTALINTLNATFQITGVQLEKGSTATSFDYRPYGTELALCQRYCWNYSSAVASGAYSRFSYGETPSTVQFQGGLFFPVQMRTTPSLTAASSSNYAIFSRATVTACNSGPTIGDGTTVNSGLIVAGVASGLTAGSAGSFMANNNNTAYLLYTAEL